MADQDIDMEQLRRNQIANAFGGGAAPANPTPKPAPQSGRGFSLLDALKASFAPSGEQGTAWKKATGSNPFQQGK